MGAETVELGPVEGSIEGMRLGSKGSFVACCGGGDVGSCGVQGRQQGQIGNRPQPDGDTTHPRIVN